MAKLTVRMCRHDGIKWYVPRHLVRPPNRLAVHAAKQMASGERLMGGGRTWGPAGRGSNVALDRTRNDYEDGIALKHCPYCGQSQYDQVKTKTMPPSVEAQLAAAARYRQV